MIESNKRNDTDEFLQLTGIADLLGKKSVRATFKLHPTAIQLLSVLASQLGIKQKSLFDYLMEDEAALHAMAQSSPSNTTIKEQRIQKTFVVSKRSLAALDAVAKHAPASRDDLIERSIQRLLPVLEKERIRQRRRAEALTKIAAHFKQGNALLDDVKKLVGEEDALCQTLTAVISTYAKAYGDMKKQVNKGKQLSEFSIGALKRNQTNR
ncbi:MAG: hypothetical protein PVG51_11820 [Desulfosarcina sp.]|jgi:hypothetical protein